jgi:PAS domain S-box-containing protein
MADLSRQSTETDVLSVVIGTTEPGKPLETEEIASELGCSVEAAADSLQRLADRGLVGSRRTSGGERLWWRPLGTGSGGVAIAGDRRSDEQLPGRNLFRGTPISIAVFDRSGNIAVANERARALLELEESEQPGRQYRRPDWNLYRDDGTPLSVKEHPITRVFETGDPVFGFEHWIELPDGTERWIWGNATPLGDGEPVEYGVVGFVDVTTLKEREEKLTSDKRRLLELSSEELFGPFLGATDAPFRIAVDEVVALSDGTSLEYVTATGFPAKPLSDVIRRSDAVHDVRLLRSTDDGCRLEVHAASPTIAAVFDELGGAVISLVENPVDGSPTLTAELPGDVDPRTAMQAARQVYPDVELDAQELRYSPRMLYNIVSEALTDRKFAVLQAAYHSGYFETPRRSSGDELAEQLGITRQTFNQHLRKAEQTVFEQLFEASAEGTH